MLSMNESIYERIQALTPDEALESSQRWGMKMHDHPYLSEERRQEMENEMVDDLPIPKPLSKENGDSDGWRILGLILLIGQCTRSPAEFDHRPQPGSLH